MKFTEHINNIREISKQIHADQFRDDGKTPYFQHILATVDIVHRSQWYRGLFAEDQFIATTITYLHDAKENNIAAYEKLFLPYLQSSDLSKLVITGIETGIDAITKRPRYIEDYLTYILRVQANWYSRHIKIADITHNMYELPDGTRKDKYSLAKYILENV